MQVKIETLTLYLNEKFELGWEDELIKVEPFVTFDDGPDRQLVTILRRLV